MSIWQTIAAAVTGELPPPPPGPTAQERYWQALQRWRDAQQQFREAAGDPHLIDAAILRLRAAEHELELARQAVRAEQEQQSA